MGILDWLSPKQQVPEDTDLSIGTSLLIEHIEPHLLALPDISRHFMPAAQAALDYCREALALIHGPFDASPVIWRRTPELAALFANNDEVRQVFSRQEDIQDFAREQLIQPRFFALLWARLEEKKTFSLLEEEGRLRHEEAITNLDFSQHHLLLPRSSESELEHDLFWGLLRQLAREARGKLDARRREGKMRREESAMLRTRLARSDLSPHEIETTTQRLKKLSLENMPSSLEDTLAWVTQILSDPASLMRITPFEAGVDRMNRLLPPGAEGRHLSLCRCRVTVPALHEGILLRVSYPVAELLSRAGMRKRFELLFG
ncbi:MAG: hypothetical protein FWG81_11580 [Betaproteobacteria bacterium]|nr:hypothetical protein [Betaproteobacteria bacterium]